MFLLLEPDMLAAPRPAKIDFHASHASPQAFKLVDICLQTKCAAFFYTGSVFAIKGVRVAEAKCSW